MSKIKDAFTKGKAFIPFISAGDHGIETTERYIRVMVKADADMVEIGIPFSDPTAEGPVIQEASTRALATGVKINDIFDMVRRLRTGDDAVTIPQVDILQVPIIKGDAKSISIAAASIIAKVTRDRLMVEYDKVLPGYDFASNKGYGTKAHIAGLKELGPTPIHRRSFIHNYV